MSLRAEINALCMKKLGRLPNLTAPTGYNDKIQWLKLYDQRPDHVICCDKVAVRQWVADRAGEGVLIPATTIFPPPSYPCISKASHDSGSAVMLMTKGDLPRATNKLRRRLANKYGKGKGEWAYDLVEPQIITESLLDLPITDYKFHCVAGDVRWVQVIWDRQSGKPKECIFEPDGAVSRLHMDEKMIHAPTRAAHPGPEAWAALTALARVLAAGWRYVRVDLYWSRGQSWFGELTFWPRAGCYRNADEPVFGRMMDIDLSEKLQPVVV